MGPVVALPLALLSALTVSLEARDAGGRPDAALAERVGRALLVEGVTVVAGPEAGPRCRAGCVAVAIARSTPDRLSIRARTGTVTHERNLQLPAGTSELNEARALALQVGLLGAVAQREAARPTPRRAPLDAPLPATSREDEARPLSATVEPAQERESAPPEPPAQESPTRRTPAVARGPFPPAPTPRTPDRDEAAGFRLSIGVGPSGLAGGASDVVTGGLEVSVAAGYAQFEARLAGVWLAPRVGENAVGRYRYQLVPLLATFSAEIPRLSGLRLGVGGELVAIAVDRPSPGIDSSEGTSGGAVAEVEYRLAFERISLALAGRVSFHPEPFRELADDGREAFAYPRWSVGLTLRLQLRIF